MHASSLFHTRYDCGADGTGTYADGLQPAHGIRMVKPGDDALPVYDLLGRERKCRGRDERAHDEPDRARTCHGRGETMNDEPGRFCEHAGASAGDVTSRDLDDNLPKRLRRFPNRWK